MLMDSRYRLDHPERLLSPSIVLFESILIENLDRMIAMAGGPGRLRPHVKTHKMPEMIRLQEARGIHKHKCATIAEAEMIAGAGGRDVLIAYPLVGPNLDRLCRLIRAYPGTTFRVLVDHPGPARALSGAVQGLGRPVPTLVDLDVGMGRTGIAPGDAAESLYALIADLPGLEPDGLHAYDGQIRASDPTERRELAMAGLRPVFALRERLLARGLPVPRIVLGGTPTFPIHVDCDVPGAEVSPGTSTLHDASYATKFPDLPFTPAALLLTRVVSHPGSGRITLDLGYKAVAADPVGARLVLPGLPDATVGGQSEEHLVVDLPNPGDYPPGTPLLAIPMHVCPTVALHRRAYLIRDGELAGEWEVGARDRFLTV